MLILAERQLEHVTQAVKSLIYSKQINAATNHPLGSSAAAIPHPERDDHHKSPSRLLLGQHHTAAMSSSSPPFFF